MVFIFRSMKSAAGLSCLRSEGVLEAIRRSQETEFFIKSHIKTCLSAAGV